MDLTSEISSMLKLQNLPLLPFAIKLGYKILVPRSVIGTLRSASLEKSPLLGSPAFEEALTNMAWALLAKPVQAKPVSAKPN